jgi:hypothetical protein
MHSASWLLAPILALLVAYGARCAYRLASTTVADAVLLVILTATAMGAAYLLN